MADDRYAIDHVWHVKTLETCVVDDKCAVDYILSTTKIRP